MEFTDIAMELSRESWKASFQHPFILQLQKGILDPSIFRYYLIQDAYYLNAFSKAYEHLAEKTSKQEINKRYEEYQQEMIFKNQLLKTIGGLLTLIILAKPVNDFVDKHIMVKYIKPGVDQLNSSAFKKLNLSNFFNKNNQEDTPEEENSQKPDSKILLQKTAPLS